MKRLLLLAVLVSVAVAAILCPQRLHSGQRAPGDEKIRKEITAVLDEQRADWNRGDVESFMKAYWHSPEVTFAGKSGLTRGWDTVMGRYKKNYADAQAMGQLDFTELEVHPLGKDAAYVLGRWHLKRASDELGGFFTLVFQRFPEGWRIVHDHTSADAKTP